MDFKRMDDAPETKWFLPIGQTPANAPSYTRYPGSTITNFTTGNSVSILVDGAAYMKAWMGQIDNAVASGAGTLYLADWEFQALPIFYPLGQQTKGATAVGEVVSLAKAAGGSVLGLLSAHGGGIMSILNGFSEEAFYLHGVTSVVPDSRFPCLGSNHAKASLIKAGSSAVAMFGSIDIAGVRWDTTDHLPQNPEREFDPTHDTGVMVTGPAAGDIERAFRDRWNDSSRYGQSGLTLLPSIAGAVGSYSSSGSHSVQIVTTYGRTAKFFGYSWSPTGDFTGWALWLKAVGTATKYIYVEDQYLFPFGAPAYVSLTDFSTISNFARQTDPYYQLGQAISRGVNVILLVPHKNEEFTKNERYQRDLGIKYLTQCAQTGPGSVTIATLTVGKAADGSDSHVFVHSKLLLVDDEFMMIGSFNVNQRSMTGDSELGAGIVDQQGELVAQARQTLWSEHLTVGSSSLADVDQAISAFRNAVDNSTGRVRPYVADVAAAPVGHQWTMRFVVDPYSGPSR